MATTFALSHAMGSVSQGAATTSCYDPPAPIIEPRAIENVLSVTEDSHLQRLIKTAEKLQTDIDAIHPEKPSDAVLDAATKQIEVYLSRWSTDWKVAGYETSSIRKMQAYTKLKNRMLEMLKDLRSSGKIAYLTPEVRGLFGIDQYVEKQCKKSPDVTEECPDISGFYVPMTHTIFLDPKLSPEELAKSLLHELDHAYQYTYRLPVDITLLTGKAADKDFIDFQTFFYESQAHYYTKKFSNEPIWQHAFSPPQSEAVRVFKNLIGFVTLTTGALIGTLAYNAVTPDIDHLPLQSPLKGYIYEGALDQEMAAYLPAELVVLDNTFNTFNPVSNHDFEFHKQLAKGTETAYYPDGGLPFLFQPERHDLAINNSLHDEYYKRIGESDAVDTDSNCKALLANSQNSKQAPLLRWMSLPAEAIEKCPAYKGLSFDSVREKYLPLLFQGSERSPFRTGHAEGGEGNNPELKVVPMIYFHPQFNVTPPKKAGG